MPRDEVRLTLPAVPEYARVARLTMAGLASRVGFSYDEVEDLRIAVGEVCSLLLTGADPEGTLGFEFGVEDRRLTLDAKLTDGDVSNRTAGEDDDGEGLSAQILEAVVDEVTIDEPNGAVRLVKQRGDG